MTIKPLTDDLPVVNSTAEIPEFASEEAYAQFWETHMVGPGLLVQGLTDPETQAMAARLRGGVASVGLVGARQPRQPKATHVTTLRLDADMEQRLKAVAELKQVPYQTLLKQFVGERLYEEEKRLGVI